MRKRRAVILWIVGMIVLVLCAIGVAAAQDDFSGVWVLDKARTHDLPPGLKSFTMVVTQDAQQLVVETKLEGDFRLPEGGPGGGGPPGGSPGDMGPSHPTETTPPPLSSGPPSSTGAGRTPSGGPPAVGFPGGGVAAGYPSIGPANGAAALRMLIPKATYSLDGKETTAQIEEPRRGTATLKTKWSKDKRKLELFSLRKADVGGRSVTFTSKERWTLLDGGQVLQVQRSLEAQQGANSIKLTFGKGKGEAPTP